MSFSNNSISQKEYLKKYLSGEDEKKRKKKKITNSKVKRSKIIDDDIDLKNMRPLDDDEVELYQMDEDAPQIAGIIDERPPEVKAQEFYNSKRWKVFGGDDGVNVVDSMEKGQPQSVSDKLSVLSKEFDKDKNLSIKEDSVRSLEFNKKDQSNIKEEKKEKITKRDSNDSDMSPARSIKKDNISSSKPTSVTTKKYASSDSDESPRRQRKHQDDSDLSPPRNNKLNSGRQKHDSDPSPPRREQTRKYDQNSDSDASPPRKESTNKLSKHAEHSSRREHKRIRQRSDSDKSPPRRNKTKRSKYKKGSVNSPHRKEEKRSHRSKSESDFDSSPPRVREKYKKYEKKYVLNNTPPRRARRTSSSDSDTSPPRRVRKRSPSCDSSSPERVKQKPLSRSNTPPISVLLNRPSQIIKSNKHVSPRLSRRDLMDKKNIKRHFSDSDDSPPRRRSSNSFRHEGSASDLSPMRKSSSLKKEKSLKKSLYKPGDSSSSDGRTQSKSKKMKTTLDGKQAGLQDAKQLRKELSDLRMKEDVMFSKMEASVSGVGAAPVKRDRKTGQVRDLEKEKEALKEKEAKASIVTEKYSKWGKGLKQVEDAAERAAEIMKEMNKPLARYVDDKDLDEFLKKQEREGDPMLDYIKKKQSEATPLTGEKPVYKGSYNPNRFGIRPGHRWDGVVRSNGFEKEWFTTQNAKKARNEEAYKWSTSDM